MCATAWQIAVLVDIEMNEIRKHVMVEVQFNVHIEVFQIRIKIDALLTCNEPLFYGAEFGIQGRIK